MDTLKVCAEEKQIHKAAMNREQNQMYARVLPNSEIGCKSKGYHNHTLSIKKKQQRRKQKMWTL